MMRFKYGFLNHIWNYRVNSFISGLFYWIRIKKSSIFNFIYQNERGILKIIKELKNPVNKIHYQTSNKINVWQTPTSTNPNPQWGTANWAPLKGLPPHELTPYCITRSHPLSHQKSQLDEWIIQEVSEKVPTHIAQLFQSTSPQKVKECSWLEYRP